MPVHWDRLYQLLPNRTDPRGHRVLPNPLILGGWMASDSEKRERLRVHLAWAEKEGVLVEVNDFLSTLSEEQWYHEGD